MVFYKQNTKLFQHFFSVRAPDEATFQSCFCSLFLGFWKKGPSLDSDVTVGGIPPGSAPGFMAALGKDVCERITRRGGAVKENVSRKRLIADNDSSVIVFRCSSEWFMCR